MEHTVLFEEPILRWDEGIALGNGAIGALIWGRPKALRIALDRADIWDTTPCPGVEWPEFSYPGMVKLARQGDLAEIRRIFDGPYNCPIPSKLPVGALVLRLPGKWAGGRLHLQEAAAEIDCTEVTLRAFLHAGRRVGLLEIRGEGEAACSWELEHPDYQAAPGGPGPVDSVDTASLQQLHYERAVPGRRGDVRFFIQKITPSFSYGVFAAERREKGRRLLAYTVGASVDTDGGGQDWIAHSAALAEQALAQGYEEGFRQHRQWWQGYWDKSALSLPDPLFERNWYLAAYLLASCSRRGGYPMPLQGLWTADDGKLPPWKGDYHHDLNTELSYYPYLKAGHLEEGLCFLDFLWALRDRGAAFAKRFYHAPGACLPATMTIDAQPLGGWGMYSLSPTLCAWLALMFERHYRYTGDRDFLRDRAYPYMKDAGVFLESLLEERGGVLALPVSSSPEIHDDTLAAFLTPNSNFDLALMRSLYERLANCAAVLDTGEEGRWKSVLERLPPLAVDGRGVLRLSPDESLEESHRHHSHLMAIHPLRQLVWEREEDRRVIAACIRDLERLGKGAWVGYSFCWMAELYAIAKNGAAAAWHLRVFWESFCSKNGFHLNGDYQNRGITASHYRPFTLEGNMCAADALQEMLLYTEQGRVEIFPAIPDDWRRGRVAFRRFRGEQGIWVSAALEDGRLTQLEIGFERDAAVMLCRNRYLKELPGRAAEGPGWKICGRAGETLTLV